MISDDLRKEAKSYFDNVSPSHDWHHVRRVVEVCKTICNSEDARSKIVITAAWLHDIGRSRENRGLVKDHANWGAKEAKKILSKRNFKKKITKEVVHCIRSHRYSNDCNPTTLEAKILSDADNLDALGAIGIARTFSYSGENDRTLANTKIPPEDDPSDSGQTGLNHLVKKILRLREMMYTDSGQRLARKRHAFVEKFLTQLKDEISM